MPEITNHAQVRAKERIGLNNSQIQSLLPRVILKGKTINDYNQKPKMQKYLKNVLKAGQEGNTLRVFGNQIFIFTAGMLCLTVLTIPASILQKVQNKF